MDTHTSCAPFPLPEFAKYAQERLPPVAGRRLVAAVHIAGAKAGWGLIMQSGGLLPCTVNLPLRELLLKEFRVPPETLQRIDVLLMDGKPVDNPETTRVPSGARIALAAGLPGIAGLAMKSGSPIRGLRPGITHQEGGADDVAPAPGYIELALFSLALPLLAGHFLARGVTLTTTQLCRYIPRMGSGLCTCNGREMSFTELEAHLKALPGEHAVLFSALLPTG